MAFHSRLASLATRETDMGIGKEMLFLGGYLSIPELVAELARERAALARDGAADRTTTGTNESHPEPDEPPANVAAKAGA